MILETCPTGIQPIATFLYTFLTTIQIAVPIMLIISLTIKLLKLMSSPEDKKKKQTTGIKNSFISLIIIFLIPTFIKVGMNMVGDNTEFTACFSNAKFSLNSNYIEPNKSKKKKGNKINDTSGYEKGEERKDRSVLSKRGNSNIAVKSKGGDRYEITIGDITYQIMGQNEASVGGQILRDGRTFSTGGCGPTTLASALSSFGYKGNPVEVNQAGSDVSVESHVKAIKTLQSQGKLSKRVIVDSHPKSSLPNSADEFYRKVRGALEQGHAVVMDIREGSKEGQNYCNIYGTGDYFENEGAIHAHWTTIAAYDPGNDNALFANSCGARQWAPLRRIMDLTYEAYSGQVFNDEGGWVGSYVEIYE